MNGKGSAKGKRNLDNNIGLVFACFESDGNVGKEDKPTCVMPRLDMDPGS